jgi:uncharacterized membrane protein
MSAARDRGTCHALRASDRRRIDQKGNTSMERMLVVIFESADKAYEASRVLRTLEDESVIALHADTIVTRDHDGVTTVLKRHQVTPEATLAGTVIGGFLGLLGGPLGVAIGAVSGLALGATTDVVRARLDGDFVADVTNMLSPGRTAVVAEIDEESTAPVDLRMTALGGLVLRRALSDVEDSEYEKEKGSLKKKLQQTLDRAKARRAERHANDTGGSHV